MRSFTADRALRILLVLLVGGFLFTISGTFEQRVVQAGDTAPKFSITADDGRTFTPASFGGKVLVVNFWATWCPPCVAEMPSLDAFARQMRPEGVVVLGISVDRNENAYRNFVSRSRLSFPTARDPEANISSDYGTFKWPETYVIDTSGKVRQKFIGEQNWMDPQLIAGIRAML